MKNKCKEYKEGLKRAESDALISKQLLARVYHAFTNKEANITDLMVDVGNCTSSLTVDLNVKEIGANSPLKECMPNTVRNVKLNSAEKKVKRRRLRNFSKFITRQTHRTSPKQMEKKPEINESYDYSK